MGGCAMKIFLWALAMAFLSLSFTACGDSPEKFVNDVVNSGIKCETREYDKAKCDELAVEFRERNHNFSEDEQRRIQKLVVEKFFIELKKLNEKNTKEGPTL
jgi:hypothetical protein